MFEFELADKVTVSVSGEVGEIKGRAEYKTGPNQYWIIYKAADGRAVTSWFDAEDLHLKDENTKVM